MIGKTNIRFLRPMLAKFHYAGFILIDLIRGTNIVKQYKYYIKVNDLKKEEIKLIRDKKFHSFLIDLKKNKYFKNKFPLNENKYEQLYSCFTDLSFMDKDIINKKRDVILDTETYQCESAYTGGSSGTPFHYFVDKISISASRGFNYFLWNRFLGYNLGDRIIVIAGSSLGKKKSLLKRVYFFLQNKHFVAGDIVNLHNCRKLVDLINCKHKKTYIYGYPSSILSYVNLMASEFVINKENVKGIITTSEMLSQEHKEKIEFFFNSRVLNVYGANDGGVMSGSIDNENFIYNGMDCFVEHVEIKGQFELVLTNLNSRSLPFVRYRVGDNVDYLFEDDSWPFYFKGVLGRTRDFLIDEKGNRIHGSVVNKIFKEINGIQQYQIIQSTLSNLEIRVQSSLDVDECEIKQILIDKFKNKLGKLMEISVVVNGQFTKKDNSKHSQIVNYVN